MGKIFLDSGYRRKRSLYKRAVRWGKGHLRAFAMAGGFLALVVAGLQYFAGGASLSVGVVGFSSNAGSLPKNQVPVVFRIENSGRSPAFITEMNASIKLLWHGDLPDKPEYAEAMDHPPNWSVMAGESHRLVLDLTFAAGLGVIDKQLIKLLEGGVARLYIYGFIAYRNGLALAPLTYMTGFCAHYNPKTSIFDDCENAAYEYRYITASRSE